MKPFPLVDVFIRLGDVRDQNLKLSEIAPNFGRSWPSQILEGLAPKICTHIVVHALRHVTWKSIVMFLPLGHSPRVISPNTQNFKPTFERSFKNNVAGPRSSLGCVVAMFGYSLARVQIWAGSTTWVVMGKS